MSLAVGIDVGAYKCAAAVCRQGEREAERKVLNITTKRIGFAELDAWMVQQGAPNRRGGDGVKRSLLVEPGQPPASAWVRGRGGQPAGGQVFREAPSAAEQE